MNEKRKVYCGCEGCGCEGCGCETNCHCKDICNCGKVANQFSEKLPQPRSGVVTAEPLKTEVGVHFQTINSDAARSHETAVVKGFWEEEVTTSFILSKIALIHSECSELLEAIRKDKGTNEVLFEIADIYIRTVDLYEGLKRSGYLPPEANLSQAVSEKMDINETRPRKHGNLA